MTLTTMMRMAREGSLATVLAVALIAVPSLAFAGATPTASGAHTHSGTTPPAVHGTDPGNHGPHGGTVPTPPTLPNGTSNGSTGSTGTTATNGSSIGTEVMAGALIGLGILMLLLKDNTKAQSILQTILQAIGMGSMMNGSLGNGGIINLLTSLLGGLNGGSNPLGALGSTGTDLGSLGSAIGGAGSIGNGNVGLNAERVAITAGAVTAHAIQDATQIGFGRKGGGNR